MSETSRNTASAMPENVRALLASKRDGVRCGNVDGVPVVRVRRTLVDIDAETVLAMFRVGMLIGARRDWIFAR